MTKIKILSGNYEWKVGVKKTCKNLAIFLLPSLVAHQASVPQEYAWIVAGVIYMIKNYLENQ